MVKKQDLKLCALFKTKAGILGEVIFLAFFNLRRRGPRFTLIQKYERASTSNGHRFPALFFTWTDGPQILTGC